MFAPIASGPIAAGYDVPTAVLVQGGGTISYTGSAAGKATVKAQGSSTLTLIGSASSQADVPVPHSLLGWGPLAAGPLGAAPSIITTSGVVNGAASSTYEFSNSGLIKALVKGSAPGLFLDPYVITVGDASATIVSYPAPPTTPDWDIDVGEPGFTITEYPRSTASLPSVPFIDFVGSGTIGVPAGINAASTFSLTGSGAITLVAKGQATSTFQLFAAGSVGAIAKGQGSSTFELPGSGFIVSTSGGRIGVAAGSISFVGTGRIGYLGEVRGGSTFELIGQAYASVRVTASADGLIAFRGTGTAGIPAGARVALPSQSANSGRILSSQIIGTIED